MVAAGVETTKGMLDELRTFLGSLAECRQGDDFLATSQQLYKHFITLLDTQAFHLHRRPEDDHDSEAYAAELSAFLATCLSAVKAAAANQNDGLLEAAFSGAMQVLKIHSHSLPEEFPGYVFEEVMMAVVQNRESAILMSSAMGQLGDLHIYGHRALKRMMENGVVTVSQAYLVLSAVEMNKAEMPTFCSNHNTISWKKRAIAFSSCWMCLLKSLGEADDESVIKQVLLRLDEHVIPYLGKPALLIDFLASLFTRGGIIGWLSLSSLFTLIRKCRLDYPKFYDHLLTMMTPEVMHSRYRRRFLTLTGTFMMRSTHLSVEHRRAFLKRVTRLALGAPPSAVRWIIPFCYNMIKCHQDDLYDMIHAKTDGNNDNIHGGKDQLHELSALFSFHVGPIARQAAMLKERMVRPSFSLEKYLRDGDRFTVPALLEAELAHKWSKAPPMASTIRSTLFTP